MADLAIILHELGMAQYLSNFIENGFETWNDVLEITEYDLDTLGVKLGHRRRLQQRVAKERRGHSDWASQDNVHDKHVRKKRRYKWHPKPDPNAPKKPLTAYALFANQKRIELQYKGLTFPEMAIEIGRLWRELPDNEKRVAQDKAVKAREEYKEALAEYKKSDDYIKHEKYIMEWKAKKFARKPEQAAHDKPLGPSQVEASPGSVATNTDPQSAQSVAEDSLSITLSDPWSCLSPLPLVEHMPETLWSPLSQKEPADDARQEPLQFFSQNTAGNVDDYTLDTNLAKPYGGAGIANGLFWVGNR